MKKKSNTQEERLKIATHDSVTGEKSHWFSWIAIPLARTQSKTIQQQYDAGCRMFDLRAKYAFKKWRGAHGWWYTKRDFEGILEQINNLSDPIADPIEIQVTYEGRAKNAQEFFEMAKGWKKKYTNVIWNTVNAKYSDNSLKVNYTVLIPADKGARGGVQSFLPLDGKTWHIILPIPWLWKQFYFKHVEFNTKQFQFVDFL